MCDILQMANFRYNVVCISQPPEQLLERQTVYRLFAEFGAISKLYIDPEGTAIKIYYSNPAHVVSAISALNGIPPFNLKLTNKSEYLKKYPSNSSIPQQDQSSLDIMYEDDIDAVPGDRLYTIRGKEVQTFQSDSGELFVSVGELKKQGFELFKNNFRPADISDEEYLAQLQNYLSFKARKYLKMFPHKVNHRDVEKVTNNVVRIFTSSPTQNGSQKSNLSNKVSSPLPPHTPERPAVPSNSVSALRKPHGTGNATSPMNNASANTAPTPLVKKIPEYATVDVPLNRPVQVCVTHVINSQKCYVYLKSRQSSFRDLLVRTTKEARSASEAVPEEGKMCFAQFEGEWYRAIVLQTAPLRVLFIDFGNYNNEQLKEIRSMSDELALVPAEALTLNFGTNTPAKPLEFDDIITITAIKQCADKSISARIETSAVLSDDSSKNNKTAKVQSTASNINNYKKNSQDNGSPVSALNNRTNDKENSFKQNNSFAPNRNNLGEVKPAAKADEPKVSTSKSTPQAITKNIVKPANKEESTRKNSFSAAKHLLKMSAGAQEKKNTFNPPRKTIMDVSEAGPGVLQYSEILEDKCICFVCPHSALEDLNLLDSVGDVAHQDLEYIAKIGDCVAVFKEDEAKWVRGTIINMSNNKYTVALIDYGTIESTDKVCKLSQQYLDVPEFVCVCVGSKRFTASTDKDTIDCEVVSKNKLKVSYPDGTSEVVTCERWDPFLTSDLAAPAKKPEIIVTERPKNPTFAVDEVVVIVNFCDGKLLVRNKNCKTALTILQKNIAEYEAAVLKEPPKPRQIVLCPFENGLELYRAVVLKLNGKYCDVEYLDLGTVDSVLADSLRGISESLAKQELTLAPITLRGSPEEEYTEAALELIQKYCDEKDKFILKKMPGNTHDLLTSSKESLSKILQNCGKSDCVLFPDLPKPNVAIGTIQLLCVNNEQISDNFVTFMCTNGVTQEDIGKILNVTSELSDTTPHMPALDEICFAEFEGEWYRGRVIETNKEVDQHKILYIDYGNEGIVSSAEVRKLTEGFETIPPLGIKCKIEDDNDVKVEAEGEYNVEILSCKGEEYSVNICGKL